MVVKVDLKRELDAYHARYGQFRPLEVPERRYLMIDGHGDPNGPAVTTAAAHDPAPAGRRAHGSARR